MYLNPIALAIRAVSAEFAKRMYIPVTLITGGILVVLIGFSIWLVTMSGWWWFLLGPLLFLAIVFVIAATLTALLINILKPAQNKTQRKEVRQFVDSLQHTSEAIQTPKFIILFRLVKDVVFPSQQGYIRELTANATSLKGGLENIIHSFKN